MAENTQLNMGIGRLGDVAFKRKYRWYKNK